MRYEYAIDEVWEYPDEAALNARGAVGWRLVAIHDPRPDEAGGGPRPVRYVWCREVAASATSAG